MVDTVHTSLSSAYTAYTSAATGDRVLLAPGTYNQSTRKSLTKNASGLVTFGSQRTGAAIITGSPIDLTSNNIIFQGFDLQYSITGDYVNIDGNGCQMTRNKIHFGNTGVGTSSKWIQSSGNNTIFDHNEIFGKTTIDDMFLAQSSTGCKVLWNHFHDFIQNPSDTKSEVIRFGNSNLAYTNYAGEIAFNRIDTVDADVEVISIKCTNVDVHDNTLVNTNGNIVLRQAYNCKINNNILYNSGIRAYGSGHEITRNEIINNSSSGSTRSLIMGSGDVEELPVATLNANYARFKNNTVRNNIISNSNVSSSVFLVLGDASSLTFQPTGNNISDNIIIGSTGTLTDAISSASWAANTVTGNILNASGTATVGDMPTSGYGTQTHNLTQKANGTYRCCFFLLPENVGPFAA